MYSQWVVCEHCDAVHHRLPLAAGETSRCLNCMSVLYRAPRLTVDQWLALTVAAAVCFALANAYPVIRISMRGLHAEATLWQSVVALARSPAAPIAMPAALAAIVVPGLQIALLGWLLAFARVGRRAPGFAGAMKMVDALRPWSMIDVCLLGALVAIVKLSSYVSVAPGVGIWAIAVLMVLIALIGSRDMHWLWEMANEDTR